jgi:hypothetical protein
MHFGFTIDDLRLARNIRFLQIRSRTKVAINPK